MTEQPYWWYAEEAFKAAQNPLPQHRGLDEKSRPGMAEDVPTKQEAEADERGT